jgi:Ni,Fe-hydrogenase III small subunit/formate hydrogenlyase subunit 6/NADH:ubiquinone oxidoreductase subunit I
MPVWTWFGIQKGRATTAWPDGPGPNGQDGVLGLPRFDAARCGSVQTGCSDCVAACPASAITRSTAGAVQLDYARCVGCQLCTEVCPEGAFSTSHDWAFGVRDRADLLNLGDDQAAPPQPSPQCGEGASTPSPTAWGRPGGGAASTTELAQEIQAFGKSLHIRHVDAGSCNGCESELQALLNPFYNLHRLGIFFTPSPRFADLLLVTGPVTAAIREPLLRTYDAMPQPRWVMAAGTCATGGGTNGGGYACHQGLDGMLPVDVWLPGCPPNPAALIEALLLLLRRRPQRVHGGQHERA